MQINDSEPKLPENHCLHRAQCKKRLLYAQNHANSHHHGRRTLIISRPAAQALYLTPTPHRTCRCDQATITAPDATTDIPIVS